MTRLLRCALRCVLALVAPVSAMQAQNGAKTLHIAAAADLEPVLPPVLAAFERQTAIHAEASYASSATLAQQIINGAPFDMFFAADMGFPQHVIEAGLARESRPTPYARGTLVLWARRDEAVLHGRPLTLDILKDPALQSVAMANAEHAPYGKAAQAAIASMHLTATLAPKLRIAANIAQTAQYADSGNAEVGFLSLTSASTPRLQADGTFQPIPAADYPPIVQGVVTLKRAVNAEGAAQLLQFLSEPATREALHRAGLEPPR